MIQPNTATGFFGSTAIPTTNRPTMNGGKNKRYTYSKMHRKSKRRHARTPIHFRRTRARARALSRNRQRNRARALKGGNFMHGVVGASSGYSVAGQNIPPSLLSLANPAPFTNLSRNI